MQEVLDRNVRGKFLLCFGFKLFKKHLSTLVSREQAQVEKRTLKHTGKMILPFIPDSWEDEIKEKNSRIGRSGINSSQNCSLRFRSNGAQLRYILIEPPQSTFLLPVHY